MSIKDIVILLLVIAIIGAVLFDSFANFLGFITDISNGVTNAVDSNEGHIYDENSVEGSSDSYSNNQVSSTSESSQDSSKVGYDDYQRDYKTDMRDSNGNSIYLSIISTSGGQMEPGIYQVYWSSDGQINQTRIG